MCTRCYNHSRPVSSSLHRIFCSFTQRRRLLGQTSALVPVRPSSSLLLPVAIACALGGYVARDLTILDSSLARLISPTAARSVTVTVTRVTINASRCGQHPPARAVVRMFGTSSWSKWKLRLGCRTRVYRRGLAQLASALRALSSHPRRLES